MRDGDRVFGLAPSLQRRPTSTIFGAPVDRKKAPPRSKGRLEGRPSFDGLMERGRYNRPPQPKRNRLAPRIGLAERGGALLELQPREARVGPAQRHQRGVVT